LCGHSVPYSETWPPSGMTRAGVAYALATSARHTSGSGSSSLLPTPNAGVFNDGEDVERWMARREAIKAKGINGNGMGTPLSVAVALLPTPCATDGTRSSDSAARRAEAGRQADLPTKLALLPTPRATDGTKGGPNQRGSSGDLMLPSA